MAGSETLTNGARSRWPSRALLAVAGLVVVSTAVRFAAAQAFTTPWIAPDEMVYGMLGEGLWTHGTLTLRSLPSPYYSVLTPALVGAPLAALDLDNGIQWARLLQSLAMSLVAVPTFAWTRRVASTGWALAAAALVLTTPALHYAGFLMTEPLTLTVVTTALYMLARAIEEPSMWRYGVFVAWATAAAAVRLQALVLLPAFLLAAVVDSLAARDRARLRPLLWFGALAAVAAVVVAIAIVAAIAMAAARRTRTSELRNRFGPEYDRTVTETDDRRSAERELIARRERVEHLDIRPLDATARQRYLGEWNDVQARFVDDPRMSLVRADQLVELVMRERGYPMDDFEQRVADISVDHPDVVDHYRAARGIAQASERGDATTEELRQAMVHYRSLFDRLVERGRDDATVGLTAAIDSQFAFAPLVLAAPKEIRPRPILLVGPPGCGKTHLARATAGEIQAGFIAVGINDVLDMWIGNSERNLHAIFEQARRQRPCVLFFDEVDALGANRTDMLKSGGRHLINQFLNELDGVQATNEGVLILAATNAPWHLDPAFRRPGRFDRILFVAPPDLAARAEILRILLKGKPAADVDAEAVAKKTETYSGADLRALVDLAVEEKLRAAMKSGKLAPLTTRDLVDAAKKHRPTTRDWFENARNYALYANQSGLYDDILEYLKIAKP